MSAESFPSSTDIKTRLSNLTPDELKTLRDIYHDRWRKSWLRTDGWFNLFLGGLTLWLGLSGPSQTSFPRLIQAVLGLLILGQSLWAIVTPSTPAILRFAIVLLAAGVWNMLLAIVGRLAGGLFLVGLLGIAQLWWAIQAYGQYRRYKHMALPDPPDDEVRFYDEIWHAIAKGVLKRDAAVINLWVRLDKWRGLLLEDKVVFALLRQKLLIIQLKDEANFVPNSSRPMGKRRVYGRIKLNEVFERALMNRDSYEKYARWKGEEAVLAEVTPSFWQRLPRPLRIVLMIVAGLVLLYIGFIVIGVIGLIIQYS